MITDKDNHHSCIREINGRYQYVFGVWFNKMKSK